MFKVQRIYDFKPTEQECAVFVDRLYPRGVTKEKFSRCRWLKEVCPSRELRRFYHENPQQNYPEFVLRYRSELTNAAQRQALAELKRLEKRHSHITLLTAVKDVRHSHIPVLLQALADSE
ncbi:MarR family transcriptional regulator [Actinobacillus succinogenes]|uniref:Uroporphyrin-III C-methyltransferase n=1 Tax=Actinobacillus succinogenes (strain ATCC 55618 / DSM 22257 / CCUG 43843 / 130Z) TaxID=339671 RepID=A6VNF2_ACTSZ|nr:DUF488 family protein [Actinobacillus succinogenes]ABR74499.1 protein of unknown function DUF488 [Actinobacillus succinogenes 130Z]PHI41082.1 MarR family transcriptional regulator [Actinobacillus succinogenes]